MNNNELKFIYESLKKWRETRNILTYNQLTSFRGNIFEEITEFYRANNDNERIDALCDICIFYLNTKENITDFSFPDLEQMEPINDLLIIMDDLVNYMMNIQMLYKNNEIDYFFIQICIIINSLGYNWDECMKETIKEISSRTGFINTYGKFQKHPGFYSKEQFLEEFEKLNKNNSLEFKEYDTHYEIVGDSATIIRYDKWYKANYNKCLKRK